MGLAGIINDNAPNQLRLTTDDGPVLYSSDGVYGTTPVDVAFYQSQELTQANGRVPEREAAKAFQIAMEDIPYDYNIWFEFNPLNPPAETPSNNGTWRWFNDLVQNGELPRIVNDANVLLTNANSGGATAGDVVTSNAGDITRRRQWKEIERRTDGHHQALYAILHEIGHAMGGGPKEGHRFGNAWIDDQGRFVKTPIVGVEDEYGYCGQYIPAPQSPVYLRLLYSDCFKQNRDTWNLE